jgi:catalase
VDEELAAAVAEGLGVTDLPDPLPKLLKRGPKAEVATSEALSLLARPGSDGIKTRRVAILVADGVDGEAARATHAALVAQGAVPRFVGVKLGLADTMSDDPIPVEVSMETAPAVTWDAMVLLDGKSASDTLADSGHAKEFLKDQYRHCKPILVLGSSSALLDATGISEVLPNGEADPGLLRYAADQTDAALAAFVEALEKHRHFERETDPPRV